LSTYVIALLHKLTYMNFLYIDKVYSLFLIEQIDIVQHSAFNLRSIISMLSNNSTSLQISFVSRFITLDLYLMIIS
jgi:hypothetical protein